MSISERLARPEILAMPPVDIAGAPVPGTVRLDANENPFEPLVANGSGINRYPEPQPMALRQRMSALYGVKPENLWITRGSDDAIDLLIRAFCRAGQDSIAIVEPTFSAYAQFARIQGADIIRASLRQNFEFDEKAVLAALHGKSPKILFLCTPNNPTGSPVEPEAVLKLADRLPDTLVVADEAYVEFGESVSIASLACVIPNLVVLRTLSKAYGLAGARIGAAIAGPEIIELLTRVSPPYPLPAPSIAAAMSALRPERMPIHHQRIASIISERERLAKLLSTAPEVQTVRQGGNFLFLVVDNPETLAVQLAAAAIKVRFRPNAAPGGVRVTVGTPSENAALLAALGLAEQVAAARQASSVRETRETSIAASVNLDASSPVRIATGIPFYDHMLEQVAAHGGFSMSLVCDGDNHVDAHHSVEDVAIVLGNVLRIALGDRRGIGRFGFALPMDEARAEVLIDLSGRPFAKFDGSFASPDVGGLPTQMVSHVFRSLADGLGAAIHVSVTGDNDHHKVEACFKAIGRALRMAIARTDGNELPSTKGSL